MKHSIVAAIAALAVLTTSLPAQSATPGAKGNPTSKDIVQVATDAGSFTTLLAAVKAAGLVETLKGPGPFTVFAPSDAAFAKLPKGTVEALLKDVSVAVTPGEGFDSPGFFRLSYATSIERLKEGVDRIRAFVQKLESSGKLTAAR